jgi:hypothetical protein
MKLEAFKVSGKITGMESFFIHMEETSILGGRLM